jgi:hypothetical protein
MRPGRDADHTPPSIAEVKKEMSYTSTHPMGPSGPVTGFPLPLYSLWLQLCNSNAFPSHTVKHYTVTMVTNLPLLSHKRHFFSEKQSIGNKMSVVNFVAWSVTTTVVYCVWNMTAHEQKPDFVFRRNGRVHLNRRGRQFSRLLSAEVCASAVVMLDTPCSEVVWRVLATHSIRQFPLHFPSRASPFAITFQLDSTRPYGVSYNCVRFVRNQTESLQFGGNTDVAAGHSKKYNL